MGIRIPFAFVRYPRLVLFKEAQLKATTIRLSIAFSPTKNTALAKCAALLKCANIIRLHLSPPVFFIYFVGFLNHSSPFGRMTMQVNDLLR